MQDLRRSGSEAPPPTAEGKQRGSKGGAGRRTNAEEDEGRLEEFAGWIAGKSSVTSTSISVAGSPRLPPLAHEPSRPVQG